MKMKEPRAALLAYVMRTNRVIMEFNRAAKKSLGHRDELHADICYRCETFIAAESLRLWRVR